MFGKYCFLMLVAWTQGMPYWSTSYSRGNYEVPAEQKIPEIEGPTLEEHQGERYSQVEPMEEEGYTVYSTEVEYVYDDTDDETVVEEQENQEVYFPGPHQQTQHQSQSRKLPDISQTQHQSSGGYDNEIIQQPTDTTSLIQEPKDETLLNVVPYDNEGSGQYGSGDSGDGVLKETVPEDIGYGVDPAYPVDTPDLGYGIEPLPDDIGDGIEPLYPVEGGHERSYSTDSDDTGFFSNIFTNVKEKVHEVSKDAKHLFENAYDKAYEAKEKIGRNFEDLYYDLNLHLSKIAEKFRKYISSFGEYIQTGSTYAMSRFSDVLSEARCSELILKLEERMRNGDEEINKFFQTVGQKISDWMKNKKDHDHTMDDGLHPDSNDPSQHFDDPEFPDIFQDPEVHNELEYLVQENIIKQEEMDLLTQQKQNY